MQEEEQAALEEEAERRRRRVQAWQELKAKQKADEEAAAQAKADAAIKWSFEDDDDEVSFRFLLVPLCIALNSINIPFHNVVPPIMMSVMWLCCAV